MEWSAQQRIASTPTLLMVSLFIFRGCMQQSYQSGHGSPIVTLLCAGLAICVAYNGLSWGARELVRFLEYVVREIREGRNLLPFSLLFLFILFLTRNAMSPAKPSSNDPYEDTYRYRYRSPSPSPNRYPTSGSSAGGFIPTVLFLAVGVWLIAICSKKPNGFAPPAPLWQGNDPDFIARQIAELAERSRQEEVERTRRAAAEARFGRFMFG